MKKLLLSVSIVSLLTLSAVAGEGKKCDKAKCDKDKSAKAECPLKAKQCDKTAKAECQGKKTACVEKQAKLTGKGAELLR